MLGELDLVLLLELDVVLDVLVGPFPRLLLDLLVLLVELDLVGEGELHDLGVGDELLVLVEVDLLEEGPVLVGGGDVRPDLVEVGGGDERLHLVQQLLHLHVPGEAGVDLDGRLEIGLVGLPAEDDLQHRIEDHLALLANNVTKVGDHLSELGVVLDDAAAGHEGERDCDFAVAGVGADVDVAVGALVVAEGEARELYPLVLPLPVDDVLLVEQPARDIDESDLQIALDLAHRRVHAVHPLAVEHAPEGLRLLVHLGDVVLVVESELLQLLEVYLGLRSGGDVRQPIHLIYGEDGDKNIRAATRRL